MPKNKEQLLQKIETLHNLLPDDKAQIAVWRKTVQDAMLMDSLRKHEGIIMIIEKLTKDIEEINEILISQDSSELTDKRRDRQIDRRTLNYWFLSLFIGDDEIVEVEKKVNENLKYYDENKQDYIT